MRDDTFDQATGVRRFEPDRLDEDKSNGGHILKPSDPEWSESDEVGREAPDEVELGFCDSCGDDKPVDGGINIEIDRTYVDHMLVSTEYDWFCSDCRGELERELEAAEIDRHERYLEAQMDYYNEK